MLIFCGPALRQPDSDGERTRKPYLAIALELDLTVLTCLTTRHGSGPELESRPLVQTNRHRWS